VINLTSAFGCIILSFDLINRLTLAMPKSKLNSRPREAHPNSDPTGLIAPIRNFVSTTPPELRAPDPDSPRGRILRAAIQLFAEHGYDATSTRAVAEAAGVNLAMIHYYFGSKAQLYDRVIAGEIVEMYQAVIRSLPDNIAPEDALITIPLRQMAVLRDNPVRAALFRREIASGGERFREAIRTLGEYGPIKLAEMFQKSYQGAVKAGRLRDLDPSSVRECLIVIGFSAIFVAPILSVIEGRDMQDENVWQQVKSTWSTLLRQGLLVEKR
jgi:TetR/AcrR family transcriptional regulator